MKLPPTEIYLFTINLIITSAWRRRRRLWRWRLLNVQSFKRLNNNFTVYKIVDLLPHFYRHFSSIVRSIDTHDNILVQPLVCAHTHTQHVFLCAKNPKININWFRLQISSFFHYFVCQRILLRSWCLRFLCCFMSVCACLKGANTIFIGSSISIWTVVTQAMNDSKTMWFGSFSFLIHFNSRYWICPKLDSNTYT